jgi:glutathione synthase/RimK-type ligase-like ATP-grasp enzyme
VAEPADADDLARRGRRLAEAGRIEEAKAAYLEALQRDPTHFAALNDFGALLYDADYRTAARTLFARAVACHPDEPLGHVNLANLMMYADDLEAARAHYETALRLDPANAQAHQRLSALLRELGDAEGSERHRRLGFGAEPARTWPCLGDGEPVRLLLLTSTPAGDIAWRKLVDDRVFETTALAAAFHDPATALPPHRLIFNAIGDADVSRTDLEAAERLVARSDAPVVNPPARVLDTGRVRNAGRLAALPGVVTPRTLLLTRAVLEAPGAAAALAGQGLGFPLLLRSPGFHTGRHFTRVEQAADLAPAVAALPGPDLLAIACLDARGPDGFSRKYRVMMIGGELYPLHLAISADWKVHYATGAMRDHPGFQAEEARFLGAMPEALGERAMAALEAIQSALGLDYAGADFALGPAGEVLLFEANATMNIIPPDASAEWDYRRPAIARAQTAARALLTRRVQASGP